ncbi:Wax ester synthase-like Acyl-CoA acyltransferase domain-containing protein [Mycolicibacterium rutilum]|uniref:Wax ester synthase-like Acyl-CoA acyltransferase domain-containing protein n=1 Tax=Mycolicibacterium rutilum TaxID=370526 RepID=A0A1H6LQH1_MYCRU|nr:Wax ester synthase-like Acyl-CoA acyltransferase domain-containing protein [Mycolicibacterium rutilum]
MTPPPTAAVEPMRPVDAMWYWLATKFATDQFLAYAFAGTPDSVEQAVDDVLERARRCADFGLRVRPHTLNLRFPDWVSGAPIGSHSVDVWPTAGLGWQQVLDSLAGLMQRQLDPRRNTWRLHVFREVRDVPGHDGVATVVVLQMTHALGDGTRTAALAAQLFGRAAAPVPVEQAGRTRPLRDVVDAYRVRKRLARRRESGELPPEKPPVPALSTNARPHGPSVLRTVACHRDQLPGPTVLVGALVAVSDALAGHLRDQGEDVSALTAEVAIAKPGKPTARNHFAVHGVGLYPDAPTTAERYARIIEDLMSIRRRDAQMPADARLAFDGVPAPVRWAGVWRLNPDDNWSMVRGNTVVSSVERGEADLSFGGCPVVLTASYPSLMPMMGLTHGVHRIGDTVAISVHTTRSVIADVDAYLDRLTFVLRR